MTTEGLTYAIDAPDASEALSCSGMTFPAFRHLLSLQPALRLPSEGNQPTVQPVALVARAAGAIVGLVLAEIPIGADESELLSVFVDPAWRQRGVATALVAAMEQSLRSRGMRTVAASYMTGKPSVAALERIWQVRGWSAPSLRTVVMRFTPREVLAMPWYGKSNFMLAGSEIVSWAALGADERARIRESHEASPWVRPGLEPWIHDAHGFDPVSSVGLRYRGEVVGWVINHRVDERTVRFTCSFMRMDLSRRARILPLYSEAARRLTQVRCEVCTMVTPTRYPEMAEFVRRHCAPYVHFFGETRGTSKRLDG